MTGPPKGVVALVVTSVVVGAATGRRSVIIIDTKYIPNDKRTIHTRVGTVSYMITLSIGESRHSTEGGHPGANAAEASYLVQPPPPHVSPLRSLTRLRNTMSVYPVYIDYQSVAVPCMDQHMDQPY